MGAASEELDNVRHPDSELLGSDVLPYSLML